VIYKSEALSKSQNIPPLTFCYSLQLEFQLLVCVMLFQWKCWVGSQIVNLQVFHSCLYVCVAYYKWAFQRPWKKTLSKTWVCN